MRGDKNWAVETDQPCVKKYVLYFQGRQERIRRNWWRTSKDVRGLRNTTKAGLQRVLTEEDNQEREGSDLRTSM